MATIFILGCTGVVILGSVIYSIGIYKRKQAAKQHKKIYPFKIVKQPTKSEGGRENKRNVAVLGATGFVGSHVVERFIESGEHRVCAMGRRFNNSNINPKADMVYQVDMLHPESLENAFHGADTVIFSAISIPTVFSTADDIQKLNLTGAQNVLNAARKVGVQNVILIAGIGFTKEHENKEARALVSAFDQMQEMFVRANEYRNMNTCVLCFSQIYGANNRLYNDILKGQMSYFPLLEYRATFVPIEMVAEAVVKAEKKLNDEDELVCGKIINITGPPSTIKEFLTHPSLGVKIKHIPVVIVKMMASFNQFVAKVTGFVPLGAMMSPAMTAFFELDEKCYDQKIYQEALEMDEAPPIDQGISNMVAKFNNDQQRSQ